MADPAAPAVPADTLSGLTPATGLSSAEVAERRSRAPAGAGRERTSRSVAEILRANLLTRFNFILGALLAVILIGTMIAGFGSLFPVRVIRTFYALELPRGQISITLLVAALGAAALTAHWLRSYRRARDEPGRLPAGPVPR